ncbi:hypothetical protein BDV06DRAFT_118688 [Aspergillus oleicola]
MLDWNDTRFCFLPFDLFAIEKWDYTTPASEAESKRQWEILAWQYQRLTLFERWSYYKPLVGVVPPAPASQELSERILGSNQTTQERKISESHSCRGHIAPLWLRTCYDPTMATRYGELEWAANPQDFLEDRVLDNEALYAFPDGPDSWRRVLVRMPAFTEFLGACPMDGDGANFQYHSGLDDDEILQQIEAIPDERSREISRISRRVQAVLYLVDREAISAGVIKVLWLDEHGEAVWDNRIQPDGLEELTLQVQDAIRFDEIVDRDGNRGDLLLI